MIKPALAIVAAMMSVAAFAQAPAPAEMPFCSAKVTDRCKQTPGQIARQMSGAQADARDARAGGQWAPNKQAPARKAAAK